MIRPSHSDPHSTPRRWHLFAIALMTLLMSLVTSASVLAQTITVSEQSANFTRFGTPSYWRTATGFGLDGQMLYTRNNAPPLSVDNYGDWRPNLPQTGNYEVFAYIPRNYADTTQARYTVFFNGGQRDVIVNQSVYFDQWVSLGTYNFAQGQGGFVRLVDLTNERYLSKRIGFDSMKWEFRGTPPPVPGLPYVRIYDIRMADSHTLRVVLSATFDYSPTYSKSLAIDAVINGREVSQNTTSEAYTQVAASSTSIQQVFLIDFGRVGVQKFREKQIFNVRATATIDTVGYTNHNQPFTILLPTILVPGIDLFYKDAMGGDLTFHNDNNGGLEDFLVERGYQTRGPGVTYPTLYTLRYRRNIDSLAEGATALDERVNLALHNTYADKVNLVGHSKGGLVARRYTVDHRDKVRWLMMCQSPNTGALYTYVPRLWGYNLSIMYPQWPWLRPHSALPFMRPPTQAQELRSLNNRGLPDGPVYTVIYSDSLPVYYTVTSTPRIEFGLTWGDGLVPSFSQLGRIRNPNRPFDSDTIIPAFEGRIIEQVNIPGSHSGYFENPTVQVRILERL